MKTIILALSFLVFSVFCPVMADTSTSGMFLSGMQKPKPPPAPKKAKSPPKPKSPSKPKAPKPAPKPKHPPRPPF